MKKQYIFIIMIIIIFYLLFIIGSHSYKEYKINSSIDYIKNIISDIEIKINEAKEIIENKNSKAYKNKIIKEQQSYKNNWEEVIILTTEETYKKYTENIEPKKEAVIKTETDLELKIKDLTIFEKWMYFLFKKHPESDL